jgi:hypothetical protein
MAHSRRWCIRQGIEDMNAGRTIGLEEFKEHARTKHGIKA